MIPVRGEIGSTIIYSLLEELLVDGVQSEAVADPLDLGDEVAQLFDRLHLLLEVLTLGEVTKLGVGMVLGDFVQVQQRL